MAGTITHYKIGKELYNKLNIKLNKDIFLLAVQGHDLLYFIKFRDLIKFHSNSLIVDKLQDTNFSKIVKAFEDFLLSDADINVKSFFYGYLTHHIVDSIFHPFIIYESGEYEHTKETKKYQGKHAILESVIDYLLVDNINEIYKEIPKLKIDNTFKSKINYCFESVYSIKNVGNMLVTNMNNVRGFLRVYRRDKTGIKRLGYCIVDKVTGKKTEFLSFHYPSEYLQVDLNKKEKWCNPVDKKEHESSIMDLYNAALDKAYKIIMDIDKCLSEKKETDIDLNISAVHGYECNKNYKCKYFKF